MRKFVIQLVKGSTSIVEVEYELMSKHYDYALQEGQWKGKITAPTFLYEKDMNNKLVTPIWCWWAFHDSVDNCTDPIYLSIDKDVLHIEDAHTNWDQGVMRLSEIEAAVGKIRSRVVASDVTGDISQYLYQSRLKRFLSGLDGQPQIIEADLERWQTEHQAINSALLRCMAASDTKDQKS